MTSEDVLTSRYMRTTWMVNAETPLSLGKTASIRHFSSDEAVTLAEQIKKRNVFARHSRENNFYVQRAMEFADHTVVDIFLSGDPNQIAPRAEEVATQLERIAVLSSILTLKRNVLQKRLGISIHSRSAIDFSHDSHFYYLRSHTKGLKRLSGIQIDVAFVKRFGKCGFEALLDYLQTDNQLAQRVLLSLNWLFESRLEPQANGSVVKTAIALESLLIFSDSESLVQSLSERAAFILTANPAERLTIGRVLKRFYDARSATVHGGRRKSKYTPELIEIADRLVLLLCLVIAANKELWQTTDELRTWCENQRWGTPWTSLHMPFPKSYLNNTLKNANRELNPKN